MNPVQALLATLQDLTPEAAGKLKKAFSPEQALFALCVDRKETVETLAAQSWTVDKLTEALGQCGSIVSLPELLAVAVFEESIVPHGTERVFFEERVKHNGELWFVHKYDADPFPSDPHAHNYESGLKLHLGNGGLYLGKKHVGSLSKKNFIALREKVRHVDLPPL
jgi:hypothetical protein